MYCQVFLRQTPPAVHLFALSNGRIPIIELPPPAIEQIGLPPLDYDEVTRHKVVDASVAALAEQRDLLVRTIPGPDRCGTDQLFSASMFLLAQSITEWLELTNKVFRPRRFEPVSPEGDGQQLQPPQLNVVS